MAFSARNFLLNLLPLYNITSLQSVGNFVVYYSRRITFVGQFLLSRSHPTIFYYFITFNQTPPPSRCKPELAHVSLNGLHSRNVTLRYQLHAHAWHLLSQSLNPAWRERENVGTLSVTVPLGSHFDQLRSVQWGRVHPTTKKKEKRLSGLPPTT